jgi:hypothetical protein
VHNAPGNYSSWRMAIKISAWTYRDVTEFLAENDFSFSEAFNGSHETWVKLLPNGEPKTFVEIPFRHGFYTQKELSKMIHQSGVAEKVWMRWYLTDDTSDSNATMSR